MAIVGDAFAKPMLRALDEAAVGGKPYDISSLGLIISSGVMWSAEVKAQLVAHGNMFLPRLARLERGRRHGELDERARLGADDGALRDRREHKGVHRRRARGRARIRRDRGARRRRLHPGRLLQGRGEERVDLPHVRGPALVGAGRLRDRRRRRDDHPARPRFGVHQLGRREGVPRGGRGSGEAPPRGRRRARRRCARRPVRRGGDRGGRVAPGRGRPTPATRRRRSKTSRATSGPGDVVFVDAIQRGPNGKADYAWAKEAAAARPRRRSDRALGRSRCPTRARLGPDAKKGGARAPPSGRAIWLGRTTSCPCPNRPSRARRGRSG